MPICSYEFHGVGLLNTLLWIFIFYSEWMQVIYLYVRQCGLVFPLNSNCLIFCSAEWTLIPKIHRNTQNLYLPGINQASQRSMGEVWITVYVHSNRLRCTDYSYGMFFLHHKFDFKRQSKITENIPNEASWDSPCANTKGASTNIHKLRVHVDACCPLETIPSEFLKYEITSTWHEAMSLYRPKQHWKNAENAYLSTLCSGPKYSLEKNIVQVSICHAAEKNM